MRISGLKRSKEGVWDTVQNRNGSELECCWEKKWQIKKKRSMKHPTHSPFSSKRVSQCDSSRAQRRDVRALLLLHQPHNAKPCCQIGFYGSDSTCLVVSGSVFLVRVKCVCPGWDHIQIKSSLWTVAHFWIKFSPGQHTHTHRYKCPPLKILRKHYPCTGDIAHVCVCVFVWFFVSCPFRQAFWATFIFTGYEYFNLKTKWMTLGTK